MHYAEGSLKDKELEELIKSDKELLRKVQTYKTAIKKLKEFGSLLNQKDKRPLKDKINEKVKIKYTKIREYLKKKGIKETG